MVVYAVVYTVSPVSATMHFMMPSRDSVTLSTSHFKDGLRPALPSACECTGIQTPPTHRESSFNRVEMLRVQTLFSEPEASERIVNRTAQGVRFQDLYVSESRSAEWELCNKDQGIQRSNTTCNSVRIQTDADASCKQSLKPGNRSNGAQRSLAKGFPRP